MKLRIDPKTGLRSTYMDPEIPTFDYSTEGGVPLETPAGSIVLLNGRFLHWSEKNTSADKQRHAYTLHIVEGGKGVRYCQENWIQRPKEMGPWKHVENADLTPLW